jgi:hypothetical protein
METKICSKCNVSKNICEYHKDKTKKDGLRPECKSCKKKYLNENKDLITKRLKDNYLKFKEKRLENQKIYNEINVIRRREYSKKYYHNNKDRIKIYRDARKKTDPVYKLRSGMSIRLYFFLKSKNMRKNNSTFNFIGCSPEFLKNHIESQFSKGMSWDNYGLHGWHIDHIIPLSSAKTVEDIYKLCHYKNLQPLWAKDNLIKGKSFS